MGAEHEQWLRWRFGAFVETMNQHVARIQEGRRRARAFAALDYNDQRVQWYVFIDGSGHGAAPGLRTIPEPPARGKR